MNCKLSLPMLTLATLTFLPLFASFAQIHGGASAHCQVVSLSACSKEGGGTGLSADMRSIAVVSGGDSSEDNSTCGFLTGKTQGGETWSNWSPDDWCKLYMMPSPDEAGNLQREPTDSKSPYGLDSGPMLVFYAGHGTVGKFNSCSEGGWQAAGNVFQQQTVCLANVLLGDDSLRYLWQCSCNVMAHGKMLTGDIYGKKDYYNPATFEFGGDGSDVEKMRNVFSRWPTHVGNGLRMACGGTSGVCGHAQAVSERIWDNYNNKKYQVADSFLEGIFNAPSGVPLCLARGGENPIYTPLYDSEFFTKANSYDPAVNGEPYLHLLYPVRFGGESYPKDATSSSPIGSYLVFFFSSGDYDAAVSLNPPESLPERIDARSGARYLLGESLKSPVPLIGSPEQWEEGRFLDRALEFIRKQGWLESYHRAPEGMRLVIESALERELGDNFKRQQKAVLVRFRRQIPIQREAGRIELVNVLGAGGEISVLLNDDGSMIRASKIWRPIPGDAVDKVERVEWIQARSDQKALDILRESREWKAQREAYEAEPSYYVWGYKEEAGNCRQKVMRLIYQFTFLPKDNDRYQGYAPLTLEVPAQSLPGDNGLQMAEPCYADEP